MHIEVSFLALTKGPENYSLYLSHQGQGCNQIQELEGEEVLRAGTAGREENQKAGDEACAQILMKNMPCPSTQETEETVLFLIFRNNRNCF